MKRGKPLQRKTPLRSAHRWKSVHEGTSPEALEEPEVQEPREKERSRGRLKHSGQKASGAMRHTATRRAPIRATRIRSRKTPPTKAESAWMSRVAALGCICCASEGKTTKAALHHVRAGYGRGQRASHWEVLPLCPDHHQYGGMGVAFHAGPRTWEAKYGSEVLLLALVYHALGENLAAVATRRGNEPPWWGALTRGAYITEPQHRATLGLSA